MSIKVSTGLRNTLLSAGSLKATFDAGSEIRIYSGTVPADADAAIGAAVLVVTIKNGSSGITFDSAAAAGVLVKNTAETWSGIVAASGSPSFYRHVLTADAGALSTTAPRYQGTVGIGGGDMNLTAASLTAGATQTLDYHAVALPAG